MDMMLSLLVTLLGFPKYQQLLQEFFRGKDLCKSIGPAEAVACGAAVQTALLSEDIKKAQSWFCWMYTLSLGIRNEVKITNDKLRFSSEEIQRLIEEADKYKVEDAKFLEKANAMNTLEVYVYEMKKAPSDKT
ncbi:hypothetical protein PIB30_030771 [Stylosanthes scabra]|uniref:Uncharacterized protein n=1 Tax=Stylosanthes scabra TaxID=79078 RepID=A0ABU6YA86_9FABA|nr:hypothetical protein [Stylosanthes scabra]